MLIRLYFLILVCPLTFWSVPNPAGRPSKAPFISGDAFRAYSDYCYDEVDSSLDPSVVKPGNTIFVKTDYLDRFFRDVHPHIFSPYILICHNSDDPTPGRFAPFLDDEKILAWFGQNYDGTLHPKMHPIPMGIANFCWDHGNADWIKKIQEKKLKKTYLAHMQFTQQTFPDERSRVLHQFSHADFCYHPPKKHFRFYIADLAASKFEIAPRGHAYDTHRIWESLYVDTIPVVLTSSLDKLYDELPILIIDDWKQVNESFLQTKYKELRQKNFRLEKIYMDYWIQWIDSYKQPDLITNSNIKDKKCI